MTMMNATPTIILLFISVFVYGAANAAALLRVQKSGHFIAPTSFWDILCTSVTNGMMNGINGKNVMSSLAECGVCCTFATGMNKGRKEIISTRIISSCFTVLALAVFKPFGLEAWHWQAFLHLVMLGVLGVVVCMVTEGILKYVVHQPMSHERGVAYVIRRNLWFQMINTPLVALVICLYRHFVMSDLVKANHLSWGNYLETLLIIAFCSFAIGMYWRFKYRSRFLAAELEETRLLNEQLQRLQSDAERRALQAEQDRRRLMENDTPTSGESTPMQVLPDIITLTGTTSETVTIQIQNLLFIEAVGNYMKVCHLHQGQVKTDVLRATSKQMEADLRDYPMIVRCHRAFLVNLQQVERIVSKAGTMQLLIKHCKDCLPVSRSNMTEIKKAINP